VWLKAGAAAGLGVGSGSGAGLESPDRGCVTYHAGKGRHCLRQGVALPTQKAIVDAQIAEPRQRGAPPAPTRPEQGVQEEKQPVTPRSPTKGSSGRVRSNGYAAAHGPCLVMLDDTASPGKIRYSCWMLKPFRPNLIGLINQG